MDSGLSWELSPARPGARIVNFLIIHKGIDKSLFSCYNKFVIKERGNEGKPHPIEKEIKNMKFVFILALIITCGGAVMRFVNSIPKKASKFDILNLVLAGIEFLSLVFVLWYGQVF